MLTLYILCSLYCYDSRSHVSQAGIVTGVMVITRSLKLRLRAGPMQTQTFVTFSAKFVYPLPLYTLRFWILRSPSYPRLLSAESNKTQPPNPTNTAIDDGLSTFSRQHSTKPYPCNFRSKMMRCDERVGLASRTDFGPICNPIKKWDSAYAWILVIPNLLYGIPSHHDWRLWKRIVG